MQARLVALVLLALVPLVGIASWQFEGEARDTIAEAEARAVAEARGAAHEFQTLVGQVRSLLTTMVQARALDPTRPAACQGMLEGVQAVAPWPLELALVSPDGHIVCNTALGNAGRRIGTRIDVRLALEGSGFTLSDPQASRPGAPPRYYGRQPLFSGTGQVEAVLQASLDPEVLLRAALAHRGVGQRAGILDLERNLLALQPSVPGAVGRHFPPSPMFTAMQAADEGHVRGSGVGAPAIFGYARIPGTATFMVVGLDEAEVMAAVASRRMISYQALAAVALLILLALLVGGELLFLRPIRTLETTVAHIAAGDLGVRTTLGAGAASEMRVLAAHVDAMAERMAEQGLDLHRARDAAEGASAAKTWFLGAASHELRTPLNGILGWAQVLDSDPDLPAHLREAAGTIVSAGKHLATIVSRLLDVARIEAGRLSAPESGAADLRALADSCASLVRPMVDAKGLLLRVTAAAPGAVLIDATRTRQIALNFLANAVKFTDRGSVALRVSWNAVGPATGMVRVEVEDTGPGVPPEAEARLFQDFAHFDPTGRDVNGVGLGLAVSARMAAHLGGSVGHIHPAAGGSLFWADLPAALAPQPLSW